MARYSYTCVPSPAWGLRLGLCMLLPLLHQALLCAADNVTEPVSFYYTRPDLQSPIITIDHIEAEKLTPGYYFFGVYQAAQDAPLIYDTTGNLVWDGFGTSGAGVAHAIHVCNYKNSPHLCYFQGAQMMGWGKGHGVIMDNSYNIVKTVEPAGASMTVDMHEFYLLPDGRSALMTIYHPRAYDLSDYGIVDGMGWIQESRFQEIDVETGEMRFEWRSLDHVNPSESYVLPDTTWIAGDGSRKETPWDYFHINSVDKNADGDYLISGRHLSTVFKISGKDGSIIWRLNGIHSDYKLDGFTFSSQHDARWLSENSTHTLLSLYDNASNGFNQSYPESRGMIVSLNHEAMEAKMVQEYKHPSGDLADSQGNTQVLSSGNVVQGWGPTCRITEHLPNGRSVFSGWVSDADMMIYRVYKANWTAEPQWDPSVFAYSKEHWDTVFYASWNGATEVTHWRFYGSDTRDGPFEPVATIEKGGFETAHRAPRHCAYVYAEAMHGDTAIRRSPVEQTFIPGAVIRPACDDFGCPIATKYSASNVYDYTYPNKGETLLITAKFLLLERTTLELGALGLFFCVVAVTSVLMCHKMRRAHIASLVTAVKAAMNRERMRHRRFDGPGPAYTRLPTTESRLDVKRWC